MHLIIQDAEGRQRLTPELIFHLRMQVENEPDARIITLEGGPDSFCEGFDLEALRDLSSANGMLTAFADLLTALDRSPSIVIALVDGTAMGGGVGLAAAADLVLASPRASFALPETLMGLLPAMIFPYVARRIGVPRARLLALGAKPLDAAAAVKFGLVDEVADDLHGALVRHAKRFTRMDRRALAAMKALIATHYPPPEAYLTEAAARFCELAASDQTKARIASFVAGDSPWEAGAAQASQPVEQRPAIK